MGEKRLGEGRESCEKGWGGVMFCIEEIYYIVYVAIVSYHYNAAKSPR